MPVSVQQPLLATLAQRLLTAPLSEGAPSGLNSSLEDAPSKPKPQSQQNSSGYYPQPVRKSYSPPRL